MKIVHIFFSLMALAWQSPVIAEEVGYFSTNSLVRFHFFHGSVLTGDVTVELFDNDKPAAVNNFLRYLREGAYDNLILHRCVPNFIIQAGSARSGNPLSTAQFFRYLPTTSHGAITNEFGTGRRIRNDYGTLSMAKVVGDPDSATTDWFFNLGDNSQILDTNNGGFTVFGRVIAGTNVLNYFIRTNRTFGIYYSDSPVFSELPVAYNPTSVRKPRYSDIYHVRVTLLRSPIDSTRPVVQIVSPPLNSRLTNGTTVVSGTASDNVGIGLVRCSLNDESEFSAVGTVNWSADVKLIPGTNLFYVWSVDTSGNRSPMISKRLYWSVPQPVAVSRVGNGAVKGPANGQLLDINRYYTIDAVPGTGFMFLNWAVSSVDESFLSVTQRTGFFMKSNMSWTVTFVTNPFPPLKGNYVGAVFNTNLIDSKDLLLDVSLGAISFNLTEMGRVSGKLLQGGGTYSFSGGFSPDGRGRFSIPRAGTDPLVIGLQLDLTNRTDRVAGFVTDNLKSWVSRVQVARAKTGTLGQPVPWAGRYTIALPGGTDASVAPPGIGPAAATVSSGGILSLIGTLADGTPITYSTRILNDGTWPLYMPLYSGKGAVFAWPRFDTDSSSDDINGRYVWLKHVPTRPQLYTNGFVIVSSLFGSLYRQPSLAAGQMLSFGEGFFGAAGGDIAESAIISKIALSKSGTMTNLGTNQLTLAISRTNGLFSGSIKPPNSNKLVSFKGAIMQKQDSGTGFFLGTNRGGVIYLGR